MLPHVDVPPHLHRNSAKVLAAGIEQTGQFLIDLATSRMGLASLASSDILDVGCGVRFTQTIVNLAAFPFALTPASRSIVRSSTS